MISKEKHHIGTIEPIRSEELKKWTPEEKDEILSFLIGAFKKYTNNKSDEYDNMDKDLSDYVRKMLMLTEGEKEIARLMTEELKKSDVLDIIEKDKDFEKRVKKIINNALEEFFRVMFQHSNLFKNLVR